MTIPSVLAFGDSLNSAITRSLVPGIHWKSTIATPPAGTGLVDHGAIFFQCIFCNGGVVEPNTPLALELYYHLRYVKAKDIKTLMTRGKHYYVFSIFISTKTNI